MQGSALETGAWACICAPRLPCYPPTTPREGVGVRIFVKANGVRNARHAASIVRQRVTNPCARNLGPSIEYGRHRNPRDDARTRRELPKTGAASRATRSRGTQARGRPLATDLERTVRRAQPRLLALWRRSPGRWGIGVEHVSGDSVLHLIVGIILFLLALLGLLQPACFLQCRRYVRSFLPTTWTVRRLRPPVIPGNGGRGREAATVEDVGATSVGRLPSLGRILLYMRECLGGSGPLHKSPDRSAWPCKDKHRGCPAERPLYRTTNTYPRRS